MSETIRVVRVCEQCGTLWFPTYAYTCNNAARFCTGSCYEQYTQESLSSPSYVCEKKTEHEVRTRCYKALVRKLLLIAYRDGDEAFLYSEEGQALVDWVT